MNMLFPTALLFAQAGMIAGFAAAFAFPAMAMGAAQAMTLPPRR
ncbi:hypothetical protein [Elioraea rosea]|nr:hypothetical protein [Elioraea rosea]